ncbi:lysophospholipid acyltransferase family protein [Ideonella livida]|uniref:Lysophospholipid acyltransferase family protein n=1 Tax=Ideonella livida TaxID=2707176 RepID=A0A7C9TMK8_9BURK|nr:lysophospholipid acyltransferase family protein [Ideonella livida]NDY92705.1 lysophospholipid acyltransferase family protein [Ideonella livida]
MIRLLKWVGRWPLRAVHAVGGMVGWAVWLGSAGYRRRLAAHAAQAGLDPATRRASVAEVGRMFVEVPWMWFRDRDQPRTRHVLRWEGAEYVEQALAAGKGLIVLTPHLGNFELNGVAYAERWGHLKPITCLYRPARQDWLARLQVGARDGPGMRTAPASLSGVRQMIRALRQGETLGILPDQVPPDGQGVWAEFFGRRAYTMTLAARLVHQTGCAVLLTWCERLPGARGYVMHYAPLSLPPVEAGEAAAAQAVNEGMAWVIRQAPAQYLWGYNRYKGPRRTPAEPAAGSPT